MAISRIILLLLAFALASACSPAPGERDPALGPLPPGVSSAFEGLLHLDAPAFRQAAAERGFVTTDDGVLIDVQTKGLEAGHRDAFLIDGLVVHGFHPQYERVSAVAVRPSAIIRVAGLPFVRSVVPEFGSTGGDSDRDSTS